MYVLLPRRACSVHHALTHIMSLACFLPMLPAMDRRLLGTAQGSLVRLVLGVNRLKIARLESQLKEQEERCEQQAARAKLLEEQLSVARSMLDTARLAPTSVHD